ncbi:hypothetical protein I79_015168 [Cricetulus griseus]|uniref:Uncharacterized protein n=1 Tax=Cricetulus griseus TaxID=10029 RepID=G3HW20_CRIGR|nr:hypothetical protein I79_015168 [Cricetulus griseus]
MWPQLGEETKPGKTAVKGQGNTQVGVEAYAPSIMSCLDICLTQRGYYEKTPFKGCRLRL